MNHSREYWYMGSMLERSVVQKKRSCVRTATGMYSLRVASISRSVCSASTTLACREEGEINGGKREEGETNRGKGRGGRDEWRKGGRREMNGGKGRGGRDERRERERKMEGKGEEGEMNGGKGRGGRDE